MSKKRGDYIAQKLKEDPDTDSFDSVVQGTIEKQAARKGITY